jgi:hypothetical protein
LVTSALQTGIGFVRFLTLHAPMFRQSPRRNPAQRSAKLQSRSAGFQTCCIADFQIGGRGQFGARRHVGRFAGWETRDTADWEVCASTQVCATSENCAATVRKAFAVRKLHIQIPNFP